MAFDQVTARAISVEKRFQDELLGLPRDAAKKVVRALDELRNNPHHLSKPLENVEGVWRREVQPYRILFTLGPGWVHAYSVQHRQGVYMGKLAQPKNLPRAHGLQFPDLSEEATAPISLGDRLKAPKGSPCWENARWVLDCTSEDALEELIPRGIPDDLFGRLFATLNRARAEAAASAGRLELVRRDVLDAFLVPVLASRRDTPPSELVIVAPWFTRWQSANSSLDSLVRFISERRVRTTLITRPPVFPAHKEAVNTLRALPTVAISFVRDLHAKYFICDIAPTPFALVASANMTAQSFLNLEVGVFLRGSGVVEALIRELQGMTVELLSVGKRIKKWEV